MRLHSKVGRAVGPTFHFFDMCPPFTSIDMKNMVKVKVAHEPRKPTRPELIPVSVA